MLMHKVTNMALSFQFRANNYFSTWSAWDADIKLNQFTVQFFFVLPSIKKAFLLKKILNS